jgi:hypothetical protein
VNRTLVRQFEFALFHGFVTHVSFVQYQLSLHLSNRPRKAAIYYYACIRFWRRGQGEGGEVLLYYLRAHIKNKLIIKYLYNINTRVPNWGNNLQCPVL